MNNIVNREQIVASSKKLLDDNNTIRQYLKGEVTLGELTEKGIKLTMPI